MKMKKIVVISDTHIPKAALDLPQAVYDEIKSADMIMHAGDFAELAFLEKLRKLAPTYAVCGNMDMTNLKMALPQKNVIKVGLFRIGIIHGYGPMAKLKDTVKKEFSKVDVIVFGHSHAAVNEKVKNVLLFNPGSPTDRIFATYNSFGILEVGKEVTGRIIRI